MPTGGSFFGRGAPTPFFTLPKSNIFARLTNALTSPTASPPLSPSALSPPAPSPLSPPSNVIPFPGGSVDSGGGGGGGGGGFYSPSDIQADESGPGGFDHSDDDDEVAASHDQGDGGPSDGYSGDHATNLGPHDNEEDVEEPSRADVDAGIDPEEAADIGPEPTYKAGDFGPGDPGGPPPGSFMPTHYEVPEAFQRGDDGREEGDDTMTGQDYLNALDDDGMSGIGDFFKTLGENTAKAAAQTALTAADKALGGKPKPIPQAPAMSTGKKIAIAVAIGIPLLYIGTRMFRSKPAAPAVASNPRRRRRRRRR